MKTVVVKRSKDIPTLRVSLDDVRLVFDENGIAEKQKGPGRHRLTWTISRGEPGTEYSIDVTAPPEVAAENPSRIAPDGIDFGLYSFDL